MGFAIGIEYSKNPVNTAHLMRCAGAFGADLVFTVGARKYKRFGPDVGNFQIHKPVINFESWDDYARHTISNWMHIGVELVEGAQNIAHFAHPRSCVYLLGPEAGSLSPTALSLCRHTIKIDTHRCLNVAVCGAMVMFHRSLQHGIVNKYHGPRSLT